MKRKIIDTLLTIALIISVAIMAYPSISDWWNRIHASRVIAEYQEQIVKIEESKYEEMWKAARAFNQKLAKKQYLTNLTAEEREKYWGLLNINGNGIMGYIEIERINIWLPIYHGTDKSVLQMSAGHMEWTSLPVGGEDCHCVIAAHSGLPSAQLFSDLDKLKKGDRFVLHILDKQLVYEVDQIKVINPEDVEELQIVDGKDYCTLLTCTPYGINTFRLLVRGRKDLVR